MIGRVRSRSLAAAAALALGACSALGLDDFDLLPCKPGRACADLNRDLPADQCKRYYCSTSGYGCELQRKDDDDDGYADADLCEPLHDEELDCDDRKASRFPGHDEECDGIDNNCDGFIDEGADFHVREIAGVSLVEPPAGLAYAVPGQEDVYLLLTQEKGADGFSTQRTRFDDAVGFDRLEPLFDDCEGPPGNEHCNVAQLALGAAGGALLAAGIHRGNCGSGQLRVGVCSADTFALDFTTFAGDTAFAVDVDPERGCTRGPQSCDGASFPAVAMLETDGDAAQALVAWLAPAADGDCDPACVCTDSFAVMGLGLQVRGQATKGPTLAPLGEAEPVQLDDALAVGAPALAAVRTEADGGTGGYVLAYPGRDRIELLYVPQLAEGPPRVAASGSVDAAEAEHVAIAVGSASESTSQLVVAFRADGDIVVAAISLAPDGDTPFTAPQPTVVVPVDGSLSAGPYVSYTAEGFVSEDSDRPHGGYLIVWIERSEGSDRLRGQRIAARGFQALGGAFELARSEALAYAFAYTNHGTEQRFVHVTPSELHLSSITCDADN